MLITGGSRGLGLALAMELGQQGAQVAICARDAQELAQAQARLARRGIDALPFACDLADPQAAQRLITDIIARCGRIDALVNNAGIITAGPLTALTLQDFQQVMANNFWSAVHATLATLPYMRAQGQGYIVNISSIGGLVSIPHLLAYSSAKFALTGFSEGLHAEVAREGITVTTVTPGLMRTGSYRQVQVKGRHQIEFALFTLLDSLPGISIDAHVAARLIVQAMGRGAAHLTISLPARLMARMHDLWPELTAGLLRATASMLPTSGPDGRISLRGFQSESFLTRSPLTSANQRASRELNEGG